MLARFEKLCLLVAAFLAMWLGAAPPGYAEELTPAYVRLEASSYEEFTSAVNFIEGQGAVLRHRIYPHAAMGLIPEEALGVLVAAPGMREVYMGEVPDEEIQGMSRPEKYLARAYNNIYFPSKGKDTPGSAPDATVEQIDPDPLRVPEEYMDDIKAVAAARGVPPPLSPATSEFLLGHIAVAAILLESRSGYGNHNWANLEEQIATEEVISAMDWWARHSPNEELRFSYEINYRVLVNTEPIEDGGADIENVWAPQSLDYLGYPGHHYFAQAYSYIYDMRGKYGADWGFLAFILHGRDGQMFDGFYAYAYLGGPFNANVYSNGSLGPAKLDRVIAHEMGHNFYTLDEYPTSPSTCASRSGYLNAENANKQAGGSACKIDVPCVMRGASQPTPFDELEPCYYTEGQVGWWDSDEDGIPDILDVDPVVRSVLPDTAGAGSLVSGDTLFTTKISFKGTIEAIPIPNLNPYSMSRESDFTVEPVRAEYRINGGQWRPCAATDGRFDGPIEGYRFTLTGLEEWAWYTVDVRAVTEHGNVTPNDLIESSRWYVVPDSPTDSYLQLVSSSPSNLPVYVDFSPGDPSGRTGLMVRVEIAVYDAMGRKLGSLESGDFETGKLYSTEWDGMDANGERMPAGVYFIGMSSNGRLRAEKVVMIP